MLSRIRVGALGVSLVVLASCAGGGGVPATNTSRSASARVVITIPHKSTSMGLRHAQFVSASTQSATINVTPQGSTTSVAGFPMIVDLTPTTNGCALTGSGTQCTVNLLLAAGNYNFTLTTFDSTGGSGNALSAAQTVPETITVGQANTLSITLGGIPAMVDIVSCGGALTGSASSGFTLPNGAMGSVCGFGLDADANFILGAGAPTVTLTSSDPTVISVGTPASPNSFPLTSLKEAPPITLTATVTPTASSGATAVNTTATVGPPAAQIFVTDLGNASTGAGHGIIEYNQDGTTSNLVATTAPVQIAFIPANGLLYDSSLSSGISAFNLCGVQQSLSGGFPMANASSASSTNPLGLAYDSHNGFLYVGLTGFIPTKVVAYDENGTQQTLTGTFTGNPGSRFLFNPANNAIYISGGSTIAAYDETGTKLTLSGTFPNLNFASGMAYDSVNGFLYVANAGNSTVTAYDQNGNQKTLTGTFPNLNGPTDIAFNPANNFLYVTNFGNGTITVYDQQGTQQATTGFAGLQRPEGITIVP